MQTITTNGVRLRYVREGSGEPVMLLHGYLFGADWWRPQIEALRDRFDVVALDLRGQMGSEAGADASGYDLWNQAEDALGVIDQLGLRPAHVVGLSMGGMIALRLVLRHPDAVRSLVLLDTSAAPEALEAKDRYEALRQVVAAGQFEEVLPALPPVFFKDAFIESQPAAVESWLDALRGVDHQALVQIGEAIDGREDISHRLPEIRVPALVIHGTGDVAIPMERAERLAAGIAGARLERLEAGHQSNVDTADEVSHLIRDFLVGMSRSAAGSGIGETRQGTTD